ncbi:hypothetical protein [Aquamicrobium defluvii]|uniref:Uncharacterized protein n=1 Tax=Aquamicrobium defluvii TaxID=69279 RepID=A0A4R6Y4C9_9HYPH|nr:hypothetical protein [Aquamicrobium defluvii]TDR28919.1 hypothetical protein DES43_1546 [Aquamicrobium defluvii]
MSEMVERVAKAIYEASPFKMTEGPYDRQSDLYKRNCRLLARAAIEAMREPTDAMVDVGQDAFAEGINMVAGHPEPSDEASYQTYIAMIDAALSEVEG